MRVCISWPGETPYYAVIGGYVRDDLTMRISGIKQIEQDEHGNVGIWLVDDDWVGGARFPWEVSRP